MAVVQTFNPAYGGGTTISVTSTSSAVLRGYGSASLCLTNLGNQPVYVRVSKGTVAATTADYPVMPLAQVTITKDVDMDTVSAITASSTSSLHVIAGEGF
jgi:hypothetical protein